MTYQIYIGIDDTDNKDSRGTGFRARKMASLIESNKLGIVEGITRHQLFVHPDIPYTSQNSSACLEISTDNIDKLKEFCREFLLEDSAEGSDVGLCISEKHQITDKLIQYGQNAKSIVLNQDIAKKMAKEHNIYLEGLTGTKDGIIGSLAAIGLRASGNDGRFIWMNNFALRDIKGIYLAEKLLSETSIDLIIDTNKIEISNSEKIELGEWVRPVLQNNKKIIIVEKSNNTNEYEWKVASKDYIKSISQ